ncbi:MAG: hypothetical protein JST07_01885 [Bacteroidetes bacterium]|nr:hypothetical protein [Bacteroidota bacterium]
MAQIIYLKNETTGDIKQVDNGFSWGIVLLGWIYMCIKSNYGYACILALIETIISLFLVATLTDNSIKEIPPAIGIVSIGIFTTRAIIAANWGRNYASFLMKREYIKIEKTN